MQCATPYPPKSKVAIHGGDTCISGRSRRSIDARLKRWPTSNGLHEMSVEAYRAKILSLWEGASISCILLHSVVTFLRGLSKRGHGGDRLSIPDAPDETIDLVPNIVEMCTSWVVAVHQHQVSVPTGQGKCCQ